MNLTEFLYHAKKWYALFPGLVRPISGAFLHDHYVRRATARSRLRIFLDIAVGIGFRAWIPWRARAVQRRFGLDRAWRARAIGIAQARFADPNDVALYRIERADELDHYIRRFEDAALNKLINPLGWTPACALTDKQAFYRRCAAAGLPHPETIAVIERGAVQLVAFPGRRPLLIKPARGEGGRGVAFIDPGPAAADPIAFVGWLLRSFGRRSGKWIVQRRLVAHPALRALSLAALPTARITSIVDERGEPEPVSAVLRFASDPHVPVDNMKAGGLLAPIDMASGRLGVACRGYGGGDHLVHPVTGAEIAGFALPDWNEMKALATHAHRQAFLDYVLVGWDVGLTDEGPVLIEGNAKPGVLMPQRAARRGLGGQRYGELLALHLERAFVAKES